MKINLSKLDKNKDIKSLTIIDMKGSSLNIGYSRSGYIRIDITNDEKFKPWLHLGSEMRPCFSLDIENASNLVNLLKAYQKKEELYFDSLEDIYQTQILFFRSNQTLLIMGIFQGNENQHWNDKYLKFELKKLTPVIDKIDELIENTQ